MNRKLRHELPRMQVEFCEGVCLPVYRALAYLCPALKRLEEAVMINMERWRETAEGKDDGLEDSHSIIVRNL